jgi:hypothetical protein
VKRVLKEGKVPIALITPDAQKAALAFGFASATMMQRPSKARIEAARSCAVEFTVAVLLANRRLFGFADEVESLAASMREAK